MLAAAVVGDVFSSPPTEAVLAAIEQVTGDAGCLVIVMNYTGQALDALKVSSCILMKAQLHLLSRQPQRNGVVLTRQCSAPLPDIKPLRIPWTASKARLHRMLVFLPH